MSDSFSQSVTAWIEDLKSGDDQAAQKLWERYFGKLVLVASRRLRGFGRQVEDEEDLALSAFHTLCEGAAQGRFEKLHDRTDLWSLLVAITGRKAIDQIRRQTSQKRGGGKVRGNSAFIGLDGAEGVGFEQVISREPTPEFLMLMDEEHHRLLDVLHDDVQRDIVRFRLAGYKNEEIAEQVGISIRSVERKLNLIREAWSQELWV
jgi:RNA polymerase sigma factor (sigma-70 family)